MEEHGRRRPHHLVTGESGMWVFNIRIYLLGDVYAFLRLDESYLAELATGRNVFMHIYAFLSREVQRHQILGNERFQSFVKETLTILYWTPRCLLFKSHHCTPLPEFPRLSALNYQFGWINILSVH